MTETKRDGIVDVTQAYNKIINSIKEAEEAAKKADKAANDTLEVSDVYAFLCLNSHACTNSNYFKNGLSYLSVCNIVTLVCVNRT